MYIIVLVLRYIMIKDFTERNNFMYKVNFNEPKHFHFIGIGGVSMSGLAEILLKRGFTVSGSDNKESGYTENLASLGANISFPQKAENITPDIDCIVYTAAISEDNPELIAARESKKPMLTRAEFLGQVMSNYEESIAVAGTHGKTSTTSMISQVLLELDDDPTISIGGIFSAINSNIHVGDSQTFITEACEYTNSYHEFFPKYSVILNVEADHLDFFKDLAEIRQSFNKFANNTSESGFLIINKEIPNLDEITANVKATIITFGTNDSDCYASDISYDDMGNGIFNVVYKGKELGNIHLKVPGLHNISNALAAIATCMEFGISFDLIKTGIEKFNGADRRFQYKGTYNGINIVDDYAHHPTEVKVTLEATRKRYPDRNIVAIFKPHRASRVKYFVDDFADALKLADQVYLLEFTSIDDKQDGTDVNISYLADRLKGSIILPENEEGAKELAKHTGSVYVFMSSKDIYNIANDVKRLI